MQTGLVIATDNGSMHAAAVARKCSQLGHQVIVYVPRKSPKNYPMARRIMNLLPRVDVREVERGNPVRTARAARAYAKKKNLTLIELWSPDKKEDKPCR